MTIDERITASRESIDIPAFDFQTVREKAKNAKEKHIPLYKRKPFLIAASCTAAAAIFLSILLPLNLRINNSNPIEIGFSQDSNGGFVRPFESMFETMIKTDTKAEKSKNLEVFYGNFHSTDWGEFTFSKEQTCSFSLKRVVIANSTGKTISEKEIFRSEHDVSYYFSSAFYSKKNSFTDVVTYDDLAEYESAGTLLYTFTIEPTDGDTFATVFAYNQETTYGNTDNQIKCYDERSVKYVLKGGLIEFLEPEKKENISE